MRIRVLCFAVLVLLSQVKLATALAQETTTWRYKEFATPDEVIVFLNSRSSGAKEKLHIVSLDRNGNRFGVFYQALSTDQVQEPVTSAGTPVQAVQMFYKYLNSGLYSKAKALYLREATARLQDTDESWLGRLIMPVGWFVEWANKETRDGTISEVRILASDVRGEAGKVEYELIYKDGTRVQKSIPVAKEGGTWKVGLVVQ